MGQMISIFFSVKFITIFGLILVRWEGGFSSDALPSNPSTMINPQLCSVAARWTHNGRDLVRDYRSRVLLVSFFPKRCGAFYNGYEQKRKCDEFFQRYRKILLTQRKSPSIQGGGFGSIFCYSFKTFLNLFIYMLSSSTVGNNFSFFVLSYYNF